MSIDILLDSGAWSAFTQNNPIDIYQYISFIKSKGSNLTGYFNLDVVEDSVNSYKNFLIMKEEGLNPIPVFHVQAGIKDINYLLKYMETEEYIAIGSIANISTKRRIENLDMIWRDYLVDDKKMPKVKVHGLGLLSPELLSRYPWYSVDSSSWVQFAKFGAILVPRKRNGIRVFDCPPEVIFVSDRSPKRSELEGKHIESFKKLEKEKIVEYINEKGFNLGELSKDHKLRDKFNLIFFLDLERSIPEWPWPFIANRQESLW